MLQGYNSITEPRAVATGSNTQLGMTRSLDEKRKNTVECLVRSLPLAVLYPHRDLKLTRHPANAFGVWIRSFRTSFIVFWLRIRDLGQNPLTHRPNCSSLPLSSIGKRCTGNRDDE